MGWTTRIVGATTKEQADTHSLEEFGCEVHSFGQGQLPEAFRGYLGKHPAKLPIRWLPDLLVVRPDLCIKKAIESIWLVDSKSGRTNTAYWDLEKAAHAAHRLQRIALGLPIVYIWPDGCSCSYVEDLQDESLKEGPQRGSGSGTPYWLVSKKLTRTLEDVFGKEFKRQVNINASLNDGIRKASQKLCYLPSVPLEEREEEDLFACEHGIEEAERILTQRTFDWGCKP